MTIPHPIPYQGSKRKLAPEILKYFPADVHTLFEPFAGSGAVSIAAAYYNKANRYVLNDANKALMDLWKEIIDNPGQLVDDYNTLWQAQHGREREFYFEVRDQFNENPEAAKFLYLLCRCVKASIRYNSQGQFNQSPDNRRKGARPSTIKKHVFNTSKLLNRRIELFCLDYEELLLKARPEDLLYMDPPYQGVCSGRDPRYFEGVSHERFVVNLQKANERNISYIVSYDGQTGNKKFGEPLPKELGLLHLKIDAGCSSQATLLGRNANTIESLYLSPSLIKRLDFSNKRTSQVKQLSIWG